MLLKTDYQDDILDLTQNANRKFNEVVNQDGSKSFEDVTEYEQEGTPFGANDINAITKALTDEAHGVSFQFGIDGNGDYGYIKDGETAVTPFRNRHTETYKPTVRANNNDMGLYHKKRYVDTTAIPNTNSGTQTINAVYTSGNGLDLGATNTVRYIKTSNLMVIPTATKSITANGNNQDVLNYAKVNVNVPISLTTRRLTTTTAWITTQNTGYSSTVDTGSLREHGFCANLKVGDPWADWTVSGTLYIQGSTNNSTWVNLTSTTFSVISSLAQKELSATGNYRYFRVAVSSTHWREGHNVALDELVIAFN